MTDREVWKVIRHSPLSHLGLMNGLQKVYVSSAAIDAMLWVCGYLCICLQRVVYNFYWIRIQKG